MPSQTDLPFCKYCFKSLPASFQGFDICAWCLKAQVDYEARPKMRLPSYRTSLAALDEKYGRRTDR